MKDSMLHNFSRVTSAFKPHQYFATENPIKQNLKPTIDYLSRKKTRLYCSETPAPDQA